MRIAIEQRVGQIGINTTPPQIEVKQQATDYELKQLPGKLMVSNQAGKVEVSYKAARADLGFKHYKDYSRELVNKGQQSVIRGIAKYAREGDQLARIERGGQSLIAQAKENAKNEKKIGLRWKRGAEIAFRSGEQKIEFEKEDLDGVEFSSKGHQPQIDARWGKVDIYLREKPKLEIHAVNKQV